MKSVELDVTYIALRDIGPFIEGYAYTAYWQGTLWFLDEIDNERFMFTAPRFNVLLNKGYFEGGD